MSIKLPKTVIVALAMVLLAVASAGTAYAQNTSNDTKPGWGHGDKNHEHTGPPGHSNHPSHENGHEDQNDEGEDENNVHHNTMNSLIGYIGRISHFWLTIYYDHAPNSSDG